MVEDRQKDPNPNNSSDWGKTSIRIGHEDWTWGLEGHMSFGQEVSGISVGWEMQWQRWRWMQGTQQGSGGQSSTYTHKGRGDEAKTRGMSATHQCAQGSMP